LERRNLKRVLIHSIVFSPDGVSTAYLYNDIALGLVENGFDVIVLTTTPHYNVIESALTKQQLIKKLFGLYFVSYYHGIKVYHLPLKKYKKVIFRLFSFVYWHFLSLIFGLTIKNISFVISPSPPLSIGFISLLIAKFKAAKSVYNVQEIYPDLLINQGNIKSSVLIGLLKRFEKFIYNNSTAVITIDEIFYSKIKSRFINPNKLNIISNFVDTDLYKPIKAKLELPLIFDQSNDKIKLIYAGNIGFFQDWDPFLYAAKELKGENIEFLIIGEGVQKRFLEDSVKEQGLINVKIYPYQHRDFMPAINNLADIHFIVINKQIEQEGFPSKVYTIMACAKPMIVVTSVKTPLFNFLSERGCAELITENRSQGFVNSIIKLANDKSLRLNMGNNGYKHIQASYSKEIVISKYVNLLNSI
jgi:glycosyltransferase involved in cell wall biosynthesis